MNKEQAIKEINKAFEPSFANYIITALTDGATVSDEVSEQESCEDMAAIHTQGLDEGIRCAMCTNSLKNDSGCDGGCVVDEDMYKKVMNTIKNHIVPPVAPTQRWISVKERLPEESLNSVIGWDAYRERCVFVQFIDGHFQITGKNESFDIQAWMPLPPSYKGE